MNTTKHDSHGAVAGQVERGVLQHPTEPAGTGLFDEWMQHPYTKVLMESMDRDYMPRFDAEALRKDAERYRKLRSADMVMRNRLEHCADAALDVVIDALPAVGAA